MIKREGAKPTKAQIDEKGNRINSTENPFTFYANVPTKHLNELNQRFNCLVSHFVNFVKKFNVAVFIKQFYQTLWHKNAFFNATDQQQKQQKDGKQ